MSTEMNNNLKPSSNCFFEIQTTDQIKPAEMLTFFHDRYNHITSLRSTTAKHYMTIVGFIALVLAAFIRFGTDKCDSDQIKEIVQNYQFEMSVALFLVAFVGFGTIIYDAICRKIASGSCEAMKFIVEKYFQDAKGNIGIPVNSRWKYLDEEFFFSSALILLDAGLISVAFCVWLTLWNWWCVVLLLVALSIIYSLWRFVFKRYPAPGWGFPDSDRCQ